MDFGAYTYGFDASSITMTLMGFMVQDAFLDSMTDGESLLYYITTIAGLIGMCFIFLMPKRVGVANIIGWCFLMILAVVRPVGADTLFYTDLAEDQMLDRVVAYGGVVTQPEFDELIGQSPQEGENAAVPENEEMVRYRDILSDRFSSIHGTNEASGFQGFHVVTLHLKIIAALNTLNLAVNTELVPFGRRAVGSSQNFVEAVKMIRSADPESAYHTAEFVQTCSDSGVVRDTAFKPSAKVKEDSKQTWGKLNSTEIKATDAINLYLQYANYRLKSNVDESVDSMLRPPLIAPCSDPVFSVNAACEGNAAKLEKNSDLEIALRPLLITSEDGTNSWNNHETIEQVQKNLRNLMQAQTSLGEDTLNNTTVALAVPLNIDRVAAATQTVTEFEESAEDACEVAEAAAGGSSWFCTEEDYLNNNQLITNELLKRENLVDNYAGTQAAIRLASNCADMHIIKSVRHEVGIGIQTELSEKIETAYADYKNSKEFLNGFDKSSPNQQAKMVLKLKLAEIEKRVCNSTSNNGLGLDSISCMQNKQRLIQEYQNAIDMVSEAGQSNDWPAVNAIMQENADPDYTSPVRDLAASAGSVIAPIAIWFKGLIGGFSSGTYSEIMPQIIAFGVAVSLMLAPLLFILGLMFPMYAINAIIIPLMIVGYMLMVRVTFSFIHMFAGAFTTASDVELMDGGDAAIADIAMGNAYAAAFLVTGAIAMMLRSPSGIIQKIAGGADKASAVSFQEVMAAGGIVAAAKKIGGTAATVATGGTAAAVGKAVGTFKAGGYNWGNQYDSGKLAGMSDAHSAEEGAATYRALEAGGGSPSDIIRDTKRSKGQVDGATMRQKADPEYKANVEAEFLLEEAEKSSKDMLKADDMGKLAKDVKVTKTRDDGSTYEKNVDSMMTEVVEDLASKLQQQLPEGHPAKNDARRAQAMAHGVFRNMYKEGAFSQVSSKRLGGSQGPDQDLVKTFKRVAEKYAARDPNIAKEIKGDN